MKLLIAEDEFLCRRNLASIDWASIGVTLVGVCTTGLEALEKAKELKPDIIISDIKMPRMNGLELVKTLSELMPKTEFIILTAHTKFEYAQESVSLGVFEYILKPFRDEQIISSVKAAKEKIEEKNNADLCYKNLINQLKNCKYHLKNYFFNVLNSAPDAKNELSDVFGELTFDSKYIAVVISVDSNEKANLFSNNYSTFNNIMTIIQNHGVKAISFFDISLQTFFLSFDNVLTDEEAYNLTYDITDSISNYLDFNDELKYTIGIGKCVAGLENISLSFSGACTALNYNFYLGHNTVISIFDIEPNHSNINYFEFYNDDLFSNIKVGNTASALMSIKKLFAAFCEHQEDITIVQRICNEVLARISNCMTQCGQNPNQLFNKTDPWSLIKKYSTINDLERFMLDIVEVTISNIKLTRTNKNKQLINEVKLFIKANLSISLIEVANHFYLSPNYLSSIFNMETGITIKSYIITERINHAKHLLRHTNMNIYDIATLVGYKSIPHFNQIFKQLTGTTPMAYRKNASDKAEN